ncbi:MAG: universal stress protein [Polyangiales bacterium]
MPEAVTSTDHAPYIVLAGLAFDETAPHVLRAAVDIAERHVASQLHVVHVVVDEGALEQAPAAIRQHVEQIWTHIPRRIVAHLRSGVPSRSILQTAVDIAADLVVVGTHQRRGVEKLILGSVTAQVMEHAHCPVLIAMPKNYGGRTRSESVEPPCPQCLETRRQSRGATFWCEQHAHTQSRPHVYEPSESPRPQHVMQTY